METQLKLMGMWRAADRNAFILSQFQEIALSLSGEITIDDVRARAETLGLDYDAGNWLGSVFRHPAFEWTGRMRESTHKGAHNRLVKVWRHKGD